MIPVFVFTVIMLTVLGVLLAVILYVVAQKFKVKEDPRIDEVNAILPGANCGGCGYAGCRAFAEACVNADTLEGLSCPAGGANIMNEVGAYLGKTPPVTEPMIVALRCAGSCDKRAKINVYDGADSCAVSAALYAGETACSYGCLGNGDCVRACMFDALYMNPATGLPEVNEEKCVACNACVKVCPKNILELRKKGPKGRRIFVSCANKDKGGEAKKACEAACIACTKCAKACSFEAITIADNLAYIDFNKCKLCRKCVPECPTHAILEVNFPPKIKTDE